LLEINGYFNTNPVYTSEIQIPSYRIVPGQYYDIYNRPLLITDPTLSFINEYKLRYGISEIEGFASSKGLLRIQDSTLTSLINEKLEVEVHSFYFSAKSVAGILDSIRILTLEKMLEIQPFKFSNLETKKEERIFSFSNLHPDIKSVSKKLFDGGHYRQSILDTYIHIISSIKIKSGCHDLDGAQLIQTAFSVKNPIIKVSEDADEQLGTMWLFLGAVMAVRNVRAHNIKKSENFSETLEWLCFASALLRILDKSSVLKNN
jgi:uncharacterized protein (TIGR02391 family)